MVPSEHQGSYNKGRKPPLPNIPQQGARMNDAKASLPALDVSITAEVRTQVGKQNLALIGTHTGYR